MEERRPPLEWASGGWTCNGCCGEDPGRNEKAKACSNCKLVHYHNRTCQANHWKEGHKKVCRSWRNHLLAPLQRLMDGAPQGLGTSKNLPALEEADYYFTQGLLLWYRREYQQAVQYLEQVAKSIIPAWKTAKSLADVFPLESKALATWAQKLLFVAYCQMDGGDSTNARWTLVCCIDLLLTLIPKQTETPWQDRETLEDAILELMLSYEENQCMVGARHVAHAAIQCHHAQGWVDSFQRPGYMAPNLLHAPFWDRAEHPEWCRVLEDNVDVILGDYQAIHNGTFSQVGESDRGSGETDHRVVEKGDWTEYVLFGTGQNPDDGVANATKDLIRRHCPDAVSLAQDGGGEIIFSRLAPNTHIEPHCAPTNLRLTAHLGLVVPSDSSCVLRVADKWYGWETSKIIVFDDSFEHEVRNDTDQDRAVLLLRFWHPHLDNDQRAQHLQDASAKKVSQVQKRYHPPGARRNHQH